MNFTNNRGFEFVKPEEMDLHFKDSKLKLPKRATKYSAGYDIFTPCDIRLAPGEEITIPTGIKAYMEFDEVLNIYPRSGQGFKYFIRLANTVGIIDSDYYNNAKNDGHIFVKLRNEGNEGFFVPHGTAIAQGIFSKYLLTSNDTFTGSTNVREGGLGSTDKSPIQIKTKTTN